MKGSRGLAAGEGRGTEGHRRLGPRARARVRGCRPDEMQWFVQPGSGWARGFWGSPLLRRTREMPERRGFLSRPPAAVLGGRRGLRDAGAGRRQARWGWHIPERAVPRPAPPLLPLTPRDSAGDGCEPGDRDVAKFAHGAGLRDGDTGRTREEAPAFLWEARTCPGLLPIPEEGQEGGTVSGALPDAHGQGPPEVQVEEVLHLVRDLKAEAFADHHVPGGAELLVHGLLDHLGGALEGEEARGGGGARVPTLSGKQRVGKRKASRPVAGVLPADPSEGFRTGPETQTSPRQSEDTARWESRRRA